MSPYVMPGIKKDAIVLKVVSEVTQISVEDLLSSQSSWAVSHARKIAMYLMQVIFKMRVGDIQSVFEGRDGRKRKNHSTVIRAIATIQDIMEVDSDERNKVKEIYGKIILAKMKNGLVTNRRTRLTNQDREHIGILYSLGVPNKKISEMYRVTTQYISLLCSKVEKPKAAEDPKVVPIVANNDRYTNISGHLKLLEKLA